MGKSASRCARYGGLPVVRLGKILGTRSGRLVAIPLPPFTRQSCRDPQEFLFTTTSTAQPPSRALLRSIYHSRPPRTTERAQPHQHRADRHTRQLPLEVAVIRASAPWQQRHGCSGGRGGRRDRRVPTSRRVGDEFTRIASVSPGARPQPNHALANVAQNCAAGPRSLLVWFRSSYRVSEFGLILFYFFVLPQR